MEPRSNAQQDAHVPNKREAKAVELRSSGAEEQRDEGSERSRSKSSGEIPMGRGVEMFIYLHQRNTFKECILHIEITVFYQ